MSAKALEGLNISLTMEAVGRGGIVADADAIVKLTPPWIGAAGLCTFYLIVCTDASMMTCVAVSRSLT